MAALPQLVAGWAAGAGWRGVDLAVAVAVAYSETGGNTGHAGGVWNVPGGPADGPGNAAAAYARQKAGGWKQWETYRNGKYLLFMPLATPVAATAELIATSPAKRVVQGVAEAASNLPGGDIVSAAENALTLGYKAGAWISDRHNWTRVAYVVLGGALMVGAALMLSRPVWKPAADAVTARVDAAVGIAGKVAKKGI